MKTIKKKAKADLMNTTLYIIVPCFNEEAGLEKNAARLKDKLASLAEAGKVSEKSRIVLVDDGSSDSTWRVISSLCSASEVFCGVKLAANTGHQNALMAGLMFSRGRADATISIDADLQDDLDAMDAMLRQLGPSLWPEKSERKPKTVNLLGISIWHRYWEGDLQELKRLLSLCGVEVIAAPGAACSIEELKRMPEAALNVVLEAAMGLPAAEFLEEIRGTPFYVCPGLPVGFSATERIFREVCTALGVSPEPVLTESEKARARAWFKLSGVYESSGKPKGVKFAVVGTPAQEKAFSAFLTDYLAMSRTGPEEAELVFANANVISELMLKNKTFCGIEIGLPGMGYVDLTLKTQLGISGSLFLIEQVINGLMSRL